MRSHPVRTREQEETGAEQDRQDRDAEGGLEAVPEREVSRPLGRVARGIEPRGRGERVALQGDVERGGADAGRERDAGEDDRRREEADRRVGPRRVRAGGRPRASRLVQKAPQRKRMPYAAVRMDPRLTPMIATSPHGEPCSASSSSAVRVDSFATNPMVGAIPAIEATEMNAAVAMTGACRPTPLSSSMSRVDS